MKNLTSFRRYASYAGIVIAAVASVATSQAMPPTAEATGDDKVATETPEVPHHLTVNADEDHSLSLDTQVDWTGIADMSQASVLVRVTADGSSKSAEKTVSFSSFVTGGRAPASATTHLSIGTHCPSSPCNQGYTVLFQLVNGAPGEHVAFHWSATAAFTDQSNTSGDISITEE